MSDGSITSVPAAWYSDPADASKLRWWDGAAWTTQVADKPVVIPNPTAPPTTTPRYAEIPQLPQRPQWSPQQLSTFRTRRTSQTISSWLLATAILWVGIPSEFVAAFVATGYPAAAPFANLAVIALFELWLAHLDGNRLDSHGYTRVSIWWAVLLLPVYFIIRTVRVGAGGTAVLVANILSICVGLALFVELASSLLPQGSY